jgi:hypothetical protein
MIGEKEPNTIRREGMTDIHKREKFKIHQDTTQSIGLIKFLSNNSKIKGEKRISNSPKTSEETTKNTREEMKEKMKENHNVGSKKDRTEE